MHDREKAEQTVREELVDLHLNGWTVERLEQAQHAHGDDWCVLARTTTAAAAEVLVRSVAEPKGLSRTTAAATAGDDNALRAAAALSGVLLIAGGAYCCVAARTDERCGARTAPEAHDRCQGEGAAGRSRTAWSGMSSIRSVGDSTEGGAVHHAADVRP